MKGMNCVKTKFISACLAIVLLLTVCISGTMAYFTESTESGMNTILAGNLAIELEYSTDDGKNWKPLTKNSEDVLVYLPGMVRTVQIRIVNKGTLPLTYGCSALVNNIVLGKNEMDQDINLSDYLKIAVDDALHFESDKAFQKAVDSVLDNTVTQNLTCVALNQTNLELLSGELDPGATSVFRLAVFLPRSVGNAANYRLSTDPGNPDEFRPYIDLGLSVVASQVPEESRSTGN